MRSLPEHPPFAPGRSPFRQKGSAYRGDFEMLDATVKGGFAEVMQQTPEPEVRQFLRQEFHASEWYDAIPNPYLQRVAARLRGVTFERHQLDTGAWHARHAIRGIYRTLLSYVSNENVALWGPRISSIYHEFGKGRTEASGNNFVRCVRSGVPQALVDWLAPTVVGFTETALALSGAGSATMRFDGPQSDGEVSGYPLFRMQGRVDWT
jgi:hypothetical protein